MPKPTPEDEAEARRLGVSIDEYLTMKRHAAVGQSQEDRGRPPDIVAEETEAARMRRNPGLLKTRNTSPNLFVQAVKTPGEVAQMILLVICYVIGLAGIMIIWGDRVQKIAGLFQCVLLGLLIIPVMMVTSRIWVAIGERGRDLVRALVRFWPLTLVVLLFAIILIKVLILRLRS